MNLRDYNLQRLKAALTLAYLQRVPYSVPTQQVTIRTSDGVALGGTLLARQRPHLLIICHGFGSTQRSLGIVWLAEMLAGPWDVLTFDWRGYGRSGGAASLGGDEAHDLHAVLAYGRAQGYRRIGVIGESMGALITLATLGAAASTYDPDDPAAPYPERIAVLGAPADYALTGVPRPQLVRYLAPHAWARPFAPLMGFRMGVPNIPRPLDVVGNIRVPLLMLHGERDGIVPVRNAYLLHDKNPAATLRIYPGVGHGIEAMRVWAPQVLMRDLQAHFAALEPAAEPA
jgi:pimeloyl-ACP methyl ester carboxylesterase